MQTIRAFFIDRGFLEVDTPQRIPVNAPEAQIEPLSSGDWQLQTSPELAMKRLLSAGYERIFQICHCWRAAERGRKHLPEFSMLEWYRSNCCYETLMNDCESLLLQLVPEGKIDYQGKEISLSAPFERLSLHEAFTRYTDTTPEAALAEDRFEELLSFEIEPNLGIEKPTILFDYPAELAALARTRANAPHIAERFELYVAGLELANAFSELNDQTEQRKRFTHDAALLAHKTGVQSHLPEPFLSELETMPPSAGIALGIDRLVMLLLDASSIDQIVAFPPEQL